MDSDEEKPETDGIIVEVWVIEEHVGDTHLVKLFAAKMPRPHAHGQWLICDFQQHDESKNRKFKGFQKIYRMKYKPSKFARMHMVTMNSANDTDRYENPPS
jgi:hypothetical protein